MAADAATELSTSGPAEPAGIDGLHDLLGQLWCLRPDISATDRDMLALALIEVANNIVEHGTAGAAKTLSVTLRADGNEVAAVLVDDGEAVEVDLDLATMPDGDADSGRGLALARAATDVVSYQRTGSLNRWELIRRRSP